MLTLEDALSVVEELIDRSHAAGESIDQTIVLVGGSALAAHGIRALSEDVDLFAEHYSADVAVALENDLRSRFGPAFKLDITQTENLWGNILVRDIAEDARKIVETFVIGGRSYELRALGIETLFLLKLAAGRERDRRDLPLIAPRTSADRLIERFNALVAWHGDRQSLPGYADSLISELEALFSATPEETIPRLAVPEFVRRMLWDARGPQ